MTHIETLREARIHVWLDRRGQPVAKPASGKLSPGWSEYLREHRRAILDELVAEVDSVIWACSAAGVDLRVDDGCLICSGPEEVLTGELGRRIEGSREGLIWALTSQEV